MKTKTKGSIKDFEKHDSNNYTDKDDQGSENEVSS